MDFLSFDPRGGLGEHGPFQMLERHSRGGMGPELRVKSPTEPRIENSVKA